MTSFKGCYAPDGVACHVHGDTSSTPKLCAICTGGDSKPACEVGDPSTGYDANVVCVLICSDCEEAGQPAAVCAPQK